MRTYFHLPEENSSGIKDHRRNPISPLSSSSEQGVDLAYLAFTVSNKYDVAFLAIVVCNTYDGTHICYPAKNSPDFFQTT
jgi:hypothetical protein